MSTACEPQKNDNEISLLDIFAVLIRYRKFIFCMTTFTLILAIAGYFIIPVLQYNHAMENHELQGRMFLSIRPIAQEHMPISLAAIVNRADVVMESLVEAGMDSIEHQGRTVSLTNEAEQAMALHLIDMLFIRNIDPNGRPYREEDERLFSVPSINPFNIQVFFRNESGEIVVSFLRAFFCTPCALY